MAPPVVGIGVILSEIIKQFRSWTAPAEPLLDEEVDLTAVWAGRGKWGP